MLGEDETMSDIDERALPSRVAAEREDRHAGSPWHRIEFAACDLCNKRAVWRHGEGGLRCGECPRPVRW